jgi:hypothetical protein
VDTIVYDENDPKHVQVGKVFSVADGEKATHGDSTYISEEYKELRKFL